MGEERPESDGERLGARIVLAAQVVDREQALRADQLGGHPDRSEPLGAGIDVDIESSDCRAGAVR